MLRLSRRPLLRPRCPPKLSEFLVNRHCAGACATLADPIIPAQLAVGNTSKYPEFAGNVASVETRGFHYDMEQSAGNQCYHWNNNAQSYWHMGQALGKAFLGLL